VNSPLDDEHALVHRLRRQVAEYAMAVDTLGRIAGENTEPELIDAVLDLVGDLCSPAALAFIPCEHGAPGRPVLRPDTTTTLALTEAARASLANGQDWALLDAGFVVRIGTDTEPLAALAVMDLAFPEHRDDYLNMINAIRGAIAMAIHSLRGRQTLIENERLAATEEESRLAFDRSRVATCLVANDGRLLRVNSAICDLLGRSEAELLTMNFLEVTHPDDRAVGADQIRDLVAGRRRSLRLTKRYVTGQGRTIWGDVTVSAVLNDDGSVRHRIAQILDVSREHVLHESLLETQRIAHVGGWRLDLASGGVTWSPELFAMFGLEPTEPVPTYIEQQPMFTPESWERLSSAVASAQKAGASYDLELETVGADGINRWVQARGEAVRDANGAIVELHGVSLDITDRKAAEKALASSEALLRVVLDSTSDAVIRLAPGGRIEYVNGQVERNSGVPRDRWIGKTFLEMGYGEFAPIWDGYNQRVFDTGEPLSFEFEIDNAEGHRWYETKVTPEVGADGRVAHVIQTSRDITERKVASDELQMLATHDPLTGLANRSTMLEEIGRALSAGRRSGRSTAVLMMDLDHFKHVNDTLGHAPGDDLLIAAAGRIVDVVRAGDLVARLGGDEFVVVMRDLDDPTEAVRAAERLVAAFRDSFTPGGAEVFATASIGVAIAKESGAAGDLVREADTALYAAKAQGRDRVSVFNEDLRLAVTSRLAIGKDLHHALERGELATWYQPEVDLETGSVIAMEVLLRWHHPGGQIWEAERFIDVAEETGLILAIGDWALRQACAQGAAWAAARPDRPVIVRVNVSALQLAEAGLLPTLDDVLHSSGLDPAHLCVEITETALLRQTTTARENLHGIHDRGIAIAIDDFGTGYASLAYLRQYPVQLLKIDRSFIAHLTTSEHDRRLVAGIIALAAQVKVGVTAEGVEHSDQAAILHEMGCPAAQGYLYSAAVPVDLMTPLLDHAYATS
jgi:diguanylate cyclase (GGDEF)-like protein/PAS domain S-box-containing protein